MRNLFRFLIRTTGAADGVLLGRHVSPDGAERFLAFVAVVTVLIVVPGPSVLFVVSRGGRARAAGSGAAGRPDVPRGSWSAPPTRKGC